ncbi:cystatin-M [Ovis canadensis]|uniref:cystatin-M n=1 Tax=Ovis canadensis TaxID=37174 RepID=UPI003750E6E1
MPRCARACPLSSSAPRRRPHVWTNQAGWIPPRLRGRAASGGRGQAGRGAHKSGAGRGQIPTPMAMARPSLLLPMALALFALCLLVLPRDARARPGDRKVGELQELSPSDPQVQKAAQAAVANYNMGSNSDYYYRDITILRAQSQLVAGIKYYLTVDMESTACRKSAVAGDHVDLTTCPLAAEAQQEKLRCDFEILVVPWKNSSQLLKHDCVSL